MAKKDDKNDRDYYDGYNYYDHDEKDSPITLLFLIIAAGLIIKSMLSK